MEKYVKVDYYFRTLCLSKGLGFLYESIAYGFRLHLKALVIDSL
jgi:hypothetical protein